jgi:hypothetical protein
VIDGMLRLAPAKWWVFMFVIVGVITCGVVGGGR